MDVEARLLPGRKERLDAVFLCGGQGVGCRLEISGRHEGLLRLKRWIAKNSALNLTLTDAARIACLEPHYFSSTFREHAGESFKEWRCRYRVAWAVQAISGGRYSMMDIIHHAGYQNRRAFERAVKRLTGTTPGGIRRELESATSVARLKIPES